MYLNEKMTVADCAEFVRDRLPQSVILMQLAEECAEVSKAALKLARIYQGVNPTPIKEDEALEALNEELADLTVCVGCLDGIDYDAIDSIQDKKIARWATRLAKNHRR